MGLQIQGPEFIRLGVPQTFEIGQIQGRPKYMHTQLCITVKKCLLYPRLINVTRILGPFRLARRDRTLQGVQTTKTSDFKVSLL